MERDDGVNIHCYLCGNQIHAGLEFCDSCLDEVELEIDYLEAIAVAFTGFFGE